MLSRKNKIERGKQGEAQGVLMLVAPEAEEHHQEVAGRRAAAQYVEDEVEEEVYNYITFLLRFKTAPWYIEHVHYCNLFET